jgi:outer membrane lipoprotein SlyB
MSKQFVTIAAIAVCICGLSLTGCKSKDKGGDNNTAENANAQPNN